MRPRSRVPFCLGLLLLIQPVVSSAECIDYAKHMRWINGIGLPAPADALVLQGDSAYVVSSLGLVMIVDVTPPEELAMVRSFYFGNSPSGVAVDGDHLFVTTSNGLITLNLALPDSVIWEGGSNVQIPGTHGIALSGNYAFVTAGVAGVAVVDVSNINAIQIVGGFDTPGAANGMTIEGNYAYLADGGFGLHVVDISDPLSPDIVGSCDTAGTARAVAVSGTLACVADGFSGMQVIDISDVENPAIVGFVDTPGDARSVAIVGSHALVADHNPGIHAIDISNPFSPAIVGTVDLPDYALGVRVVGNVAYVAHYAWGLQLVDITHFTTPTVISGGIPPQSTNDVVIAGSRAYLADGGLRIVDVSDPAAPAPIGFAPMAGVALGVAVAGNYAYVANYHTGLQVVDIADPETPGIAGSVDTPGLARDVVLSGTHAYLADTFGLQVVDVSNPASPALVGTGLALSNSIGIAVQGQLAIMARHESGVTVIDISTPLSPTVVADFDTLAGNSYAIAIDGNYAYAAQGGYSGQDAVYVIDISNTASPQVVASVDLYGGAGSIAKRGSFVYAGPGLRVIDVVDPVNPKFVGGMVTSGYNGSAIFATDDYLYLAEDAGGLVIVPSQCEPTLNPVLFQHLEAVGESRSVVVRWDLYADEPISGFDVYRRSLPGGGAQRRNDRLLDSSSRTFRDDTVQPGRSYEYFVVAMLPDGGRIQSQAAAVTTRALELVLYQNHPNPFNPTTTISFVIPAKAHARLTIYDVRGARVRVLFDEEMTTGYRETTWDGRDDRGAAAASGVYFYELVAGKQSVTKKMMLLQ